MASTVLSYQLFNNISSQLDDGDYKYYGEIISHNNGWIEGGQSTWQQFMSTTFPTALSQGGNGEVESLTFIHKNIQYSSVENPQTTTCSNATVATLFSQALWNVTNSSSPSRRIHTYLCNGSEWKFQYCHYTGVTSICIDCDQPCWDSCTWDPVMYPCTMAECWNSTNTTSSSSYVHHSVTGTGYSRAVSGISGISSSSSSSNINIIHFFGVKPLVSNISSPAKADRLAFILLVIFSTMLVFVFGIMVLCYRTIRNRRMNRKEIWRERQRVYEKYLNVEDDVDGYDDEDEVSDTSSNQHAEMDTVVVRRMHAGSLEANTSFDGNDSNILTVVEANNMNVSDSIQIELELEISCSEAGCSESVMEGNNAVGTELSRADDEVRDVVKIIIDHEGDDNDDSRVQDDRKLDIDVVADTRS
jgi:hypothetical protein